MSVRTASLALALTLSSSATFAADLPSARLAPVVIPPPVFAWTGLFFGVQGGYEFGKSNAFLNNVVTGAGLGSGGGNENGIIGGVHIGYLTTVSALPPALGRYIGSGLANLVLGFEGDFDGTSAKTDYVFGNVNNATNAPALGSFRGRVGVALNNVLVYGTGGLAAEYRRNEYTIATGAEFQANHGIVGYTFGGGVEYAFLNDFTVRAEYRFTDFEHYHDFIPAQTAGVGQVLHQETDNRVLIGLTYRVAPPTPSPVIVRY